MSSSKTHLLLHCSTATLLFLCIDGLSMVTPVYVPRLLIQCIAAPMGGISSALITNPLDVIRARIQVLLIQFYLFLWLLDFKIVFLCSLSLFYFFIFICCEPSLIILFRFLIKHLFLSLSLSSLYPIPP